MNSSKLVGKIKRSQDEESEINIRNSYGAMVLIALGLGISSIILQLIVIIISFVIAGRPAPTLVQLASGESVSVIPIGSKERTPETIQKFVKDTMGMTFNWNGTIPNTDPNSPGTRMPDQGIRVKTSNSKDKKITTPAYEALFAFENQFREDFTKIIADLTPEAIFNQNGQVAFVPIQITTPVEIADGQWKVTVVSNLVFIRQGQPVGETIPFNKDVFIRAVEVPSLDYLSSDKIVNQSLAQTIARIRNSGLEITAITEFRPDEIIF